jgi:mannose-6-phosphate isomerase-like protein (cupin superfamily)
MTDGVFKNDQAREYFFEEGCYILEISNSPDDPQVSIARARVPPGGITKWHRLRETRERYLILSGQGIVEIGDFAPSSVSVGDFVEIPAMTRQRIENTGDSDLIFLAICTPRFEPGAYETLED